MPPGLVTGGGGEGELRASEGGATIGGATRDPSGSIPHFDFCLLLIGLLSVSVSKYSVL